MSPARVLALLALIGLVIGAALGAGCLGQTGPETRESVTGAPTSDGVSGGTVPPVSETTLPIPIPLGS